MSHVRVILATRKSVVDTIGRDIRNLQRQNVSVLCKSSVRIQRSKRCPLLDFLLCVFGPNTLHLRYQKESFDAV